MMIDERQIRLYKTEMCRNWQEIGSCRYGHKCRFAHGQEELRYIQRSPKYKTQICKTFHLTGTCLYGVRCVFIHDDHLENQATSPVKLNSFASPFGLYEKDHLFTELMWLPNFDRRYSSSSSSSSFSSSSTVTLV